jgi:germination protein M
LGARRIVPLFLVALLAGCGGSEAKTVTVTTTKTISGTTTGEAPAGSTNVLVYFLRDEKIGAAGRSVPLTPGVGAAAMRALLAGPTAEDRAAGLSSAVPSGTTLLGLDIAGGVATVDLSSQFAAGGGSLSMQARVAQVVHTLTQFPTVESVRFELEGRPVTALGGEGIDLSKPLTRKDVEALAPAVLVEAPTPGAEIASPLHASGTANTFEATFMAEIRDADGKVLAKRFVTATSGSGERGTFDFTLPFRVADEQRGTLVVYEISAEDGSRIHEVRIPIRLAL